MKVDHVSKKMNTNYKKHRQKWQLSVTLSKEKKKTKKTRRYKFLNSLEIFSYRPIRTLASIIFEKLNKYSFFFILDVQIRKIKLPFKPTGMQIPSLKHGFEEQAPTRFCLQLNPP